MTERITKDIVILYHAECNDGFGSAWAAWKKFGDEADYIPISHGYSYPDYFIDKTIFTLDLTLPKAITEKLLKTNKRLTSIDHHVGAEKITKTTQDFSFDNNHSGSVLAWKYFHPEKPVPKLLLLIEDVDIWKWEYPETKNFISAFNLYDDFSFELFDKVALEIEEPDKLEDYLLKGEVISQHNKKIISELSKIAILVEFEGYKVYAVNAPDFIKSELGHRLSESFPFAIVWRQKKDRIFVSLRSDDTINVSEIAKKYGGGGHRAAASFSFPAEQPFPWKIIRKS